MWDVRRVKCIMLEVTWEQGSNGKQRRHQTDTQRHAGIMAHSHSEVSPRDTLRAIPADEIRS